MLSLYILLLLLCLYGIVQNRGKKADEPLLSVLSHERTNAVNGLFIGLVFCSHLSGYLTRSGAYLSGDSLFYTLNGYIGQLMVVTFLLFSGYGVTESITRKGSAYVRAMPRKRLLTVWVNFAIAVLVFIALNLLLGNALTLKQCLLSLVCWESVGNSNWYILCIIYCYFCSYVASRLFSSQNLRLLAIGVLLALFVLVLCRYKQNWWYNTCFAYLAGCILSVYKHRIFPFINSHYCLCLLALLAIFLLAYNTLGRGRFFNITAMIFGFLVVTLMFKVNITSRPLTWMGRNLFPLYIYQRLPMLALAPTLNGTASPVYIYIYIFTCLAISLAITYAYDRWKLSVKFN